MVEEKKIQQTPESPRAGVGAIADEVAKILLERLPHMLPKRSPKKKTVNKKKEKEIQYGIFLDTSAIIDGRIFDIINLKLLRGPLIIPESILAELKHIGDSQDTVKRERGRRGLLSLEKIKKEKDIRLIILEGSEVLKKGNLEVDEQLIRLAKLYKGRIITCDYNLEKKANISGVVAVNMHELANRLKVIAVPGETVHITISHIGKDPSQGVGYLEDGTMIVVEKGSTFLHQTLDVVVSRVIQTSSGRILFAKQI